MPETRFQNLRRAAAVCFGASIITASLISTPGGASIVPDKLQHFLAYGVWTLLVSASPRGPRRIAAYLALVAATGGAIELIQPYVGRTGSLLDMLANLAGIAAGMAGGLILRERLYGRGMRAQAPAKQR